MSLLWVATLRAESWALIRVLRSAQLRHVSLTWLLSPLLARDTNDRPAVIFQPSDSYTCGAIPLEHRHVSSQLGPGGQWLQQWVGPTAPCHTASGQYARAPRIRPKWNIEILIAMLEVQWRSHIYRYIEKMSRWSHKCGARSRSPNYSTSCYWAVIIMLCTSIVLWSSWSRFSRRGKLNPGYNGAGRIVTACVML